MRPLVLVFALVVSLASVLGCGTPEQKASSSTTEPTASATATPQGSASTLPSGSLLFVYSNTDSDGSANVILVYDVTAQKTVARFQAAEGRHAQAVIAGEALLFNLGNEITRREYDGSNEQIIWRAAEGTHIVWMALSPDRSLLAFTVIPDGYPMTQDPRLIVFLDLASLKEVLVVPQTAELFPQFSGHVAVPTWRDDGKGIVIYGWRNAGAPGGVATIHLDGNVQVRELVGFPWIAPNGRYAWHGPEGPYMAECYPAKTSMILRALDSDTDLKTLSDGDRVLAPQEWSPDGTQVLYASYPLEKAPGECEDCKQVDLESPEWHLLHLDGFQSEPVADPAQLLKDWQGERYVETRCDGKAMLTGTCHDEASGQIKPVDMYVNDSLVASGTDLAPVGFIEP